MPYFSVRDYAYRYLCNGFEISVISDTPCHLYMRWTNVQPQIHDVPAYLRGTYLPGNRYFCFVAYTENEQEEAGDTLVHTFTKRGWNVCETRWFTFIGSVGGVYCPSTTAIFELHFAIEQVHIAGSYSNRTVWQTNVNWNACHDNPLGFRIHIGAPPLYLMEAGARLNASYFIYRNFLFFDTSLMPVGIQVGEARLDLYVTIATRTSSAVYPYIQITRGVQNDPITLANYGDQLPHTTVGGQKDIATFVLNSYNTIDLNANGRAFINPGGITRLCIRGELDVADIPPPLGTNSIGLCGAQAGGGKQPMLTICYPPILP